MSKYLQILRLLCLVIVLTPKVVYSGANEKRLLNELGLGLTGGVYNRLERPVINESDPMNVQFGLTLQQIIDVNEKNQILTTNIWLNMVWNDYNLRWNESEFGGIKSVRVPAGLLWKPDILMYNSADEDIDSTFATNVVVSSNGNCLWVPPGLFLSTCKIDITWFPFDDQQCKMKFGSWTYDSSGIDLQLMAETGDLSSFIPNGEWELIGMPAQRNVLSYDCCPEQYIDVTFTVHIRRRTLYYGFNLIIPCVLISSMALLAFTLPPDAGEKISLGVTILLSLTVFLLLVAETMPPTSDAVPLIGMYFACIMLMCSLSVVFTVLVLNYHHRGPDTHQMPRLVRIGICQWLARLLRMERPGQPLATIHQLSKKASLSRRDASLRTKSSFKGCKAPDSDDRGTRYPNHNIWTSNSRVAQELSHCHPQNNVLLLEHPRFLQAGPPPTTTDPPADQHHPVDSTTHGSHRCYLLKEILRELQKVNEKVRKDEESQDACNDWKFAAMVIDRLCLIVFTIFTFISTFAILFSAPHFTVG